MQKYTWLIEVTEPMSLRKAMQGCISDMHELYKTTEYARFCGYRL